MDFRQLRYLVTLAEEKHFTRAAAREHIAQPALSQQIRRLEDELGLPLVERTTRSVSMTDAGHLLVGRARRILADGNLAAAVIPRFHAVVNADSGAAGANRVARLPDAGDRSVWRALQHRLWAARRSPVPRIASRSTK